MTTQLRTTGFLITLLLLCISCRDHRQYTNPIFSNATHPHVLLWQGKYYYTMQSEHADRIIIWCTDDITQLAKAEKKTVWIPTDPAGKTNIWSPELHRIGHKWYIYYEADNGNTDYHQIYVIENPSTDPMKGSFSMKGCIKTNEEWNWSIHPNTFVNRGKQYLVWSGWPKRRVEDETQCIYIAEMKNPWTLGSERVKISTPVYEWERQWINPDGERSAYPIYVNENPKAFHSKDSTKVIICYAASGCWTLYSCLGMLYADAQSNLLNPSSWHKVKEPVFQGVYADSIYGATSICIVPTPNSHESYFLYEAKRLENNAQIRDIRLQKMEWDENGLPIFGKPEPLNKPLKGPSKLTSSPS